MLENYTGNVGSGILSISTICLGVGLCGRELDSLLRGRNVSYLHLAQGVLLTAGGAQSLIENGEVVYAINALALGAFSQYLKYRETLINLRHSPTLVNGTGHILFMITALALTKLTDHIYGQQL